MWDKIKSTFKVYPRVCGGTVPMTPYRGCSKGLSPRVRGNRADDPVPGMLEGSIPACAGEPSISAGRISSMRVYPRVCGGTPNLSRLRPALAGLSPRVRGNPSAWISFLRSRRSIPACAGEPVKTPLSEPTIWVYPRVCGGTVGGIQAGKELAGLSPRVRGNHSDRRPHRFGLRSIPACAGEPCPSRSRWSASPVYPRVCGGTQRISTFVGQIRGLSRVCGGTCGKTHAAGTAFGLSPRVRGNHFLHIRSA